jgi:hypothetical protein
VIDTEYLRVVQKDTGHELTVSRTQYDFAPKAFEVLKDEAATDAGNNPLPPKFAAAKKTATSAEPKKENS